MKNNSTHYHHVCPRNCYSSCSMISQVENDRLVHLVGDPLHPYTNGKLCSKGYAYLERNEHPKRLKYPYYRKNKSDSFVPITWIKAYDLIVSQLTTIYKKHGNFLPLALYKYSGNLAVLQYATDEFFHSLGGTTKIAGSPCSSAGIEALQYQTGALKMSDPAEIALSDLIILWGANPAYTNIHLVPMIMHAKARGAKVVVIDPLFTKTAELADLYIQLRPSTDGALANLLVQALVEAETYDHEFLQGHSLGFPEFYDEIKKWKQTDYLAHCDIPEAAVEVFIQWLIEAKTASHVIGFGLQRHANGGQNIRAIEALAALHGDLGRKGGGVFYTHQGSTVFTNQQVSRKDDRLLDMNHWITDPATAEGDVPIEMLWVSCRNPLTQDPKPQNIHKHFEQIPLVITVDQFMTPTARMSNLVLPTTTLFEQVDMMTSYWHKEIRFNEKAIDPFYESKNEWRMMIEMATRLNESEPGLCSFPIDAGEEEYLNRQFNPQVLDLYGVESVADLNKRTKTFRKPAGPAWEDRTFATLSGKYQFSSPEAKKNGFPATPIFTAGNAPSNSYPFWLITPHHPYALNSQFHFLDLSEEKDACVEIHPEKARELGIKNGEVIKVYNEQDDLKINAIYSPQVPKDILVIYQGWYPTANLVVNQLIPVAETDMGKNTSGANGVAYYDTFVNVVKL